MDIRNVYNEVIASTAIADGDPQPHRTALERLAMAGLHPDLLRALRSKTVEVIDETYDDKAELQQLRYRLDSIDRELAAPSGAVNLNGASLAGTNLYGACLVGASLIGARLTGANFTGANLTRASLGGASLTGANFTGANLTRANLGGASLTGANFTGANLNGASLAGTNLNGACLVGASLIGARLTGANFTGANLTRANLGGASLTGANFTGANLVGAALIRARLEGANLTGANLEGANLVGADLVRANLAPIRNDVHAVLDAAPAEVIGLLGALRRGQINGFVGTTALKPDASRPAERWFLAIRPGITPENHPVAGITERWIVEWLLDHGVAVPQPLQPPPLPRVPRPPQHLDAAELRTLSDALGTAASMEVRGILVKLGWVDPT